MQWNSFIGCFLLIAVVHCNVLKKEESIEAVSDNFQDTQVPFAETNQESYPNREKDVEDMSKVERNDWVVMEDSSDYDTEDTELSVNKDVEIEFNQDAFNIPEEVDGRIRWPHCPSVGRSIAQGSTGTCWAVALSSAIGDRICIASKGRTKVSISAYDFVRCCTKCRSNSTNNGGNIKYAWEHYAYVGVVSGSEFPTSGCMNTGCKPYPYPPCGFTTGRTCPETKYVDPIGKCNKQCVPGYERSYENDLYKGINPIKHFITVAEIQREILDNGPVPTVITVYEDFRTFLKRNTLETYISNGRNKEGKHAVKIIGWGIDSEKRPYWKCVNSWTSNGMFHILRGSNHCNVEKSVYGIRPQMRHV